MKRWWMWAALGAALVLITSSRTWVTGSVIDPVMGTTRLQATGTQAGSTLTAGALLAGAALLAGLVGSRPVRLLAALCLAGGAVLTGLPVIRSLTAPSEVAAAVAADLPGGVSGGLQIEDAAATPWPWLGLVGAVLILAGAVLCLLAWARAPREASGRAAAGDTVTSATGGGAGAVAASRGTTRSGGTTSSGDQAAVAGLAGSDEPGPERGRTSDAWEELSRGEDPTLDQD